MIFTQVHFGDIQVIHATGRSVQAALGSIRLTHAGGRVGDRGITVSVAPAFQNGRRYLVFMQDDGLVYANPIVGGAQGQFEVIQDKSTLRDYVLTADGRAVLDVGPEGVGAGSRKVDCIQGGTVFYSPGDTAQISQFHGQLPVAAGADSVSASDDAAGPEWAGPPPVSLSAFIEYTVNTALTLPLKERRLKLGNGGGRLISGAGVQVVEQDLPS